jgi:hypothetical protein
MQNTKILNRELRPNLPDQPGNSICYRVENNDIININGKIGCNIPTSKNEQERINHRRGESQGVHDRIEMSMPHTRSLLRSMQRSDKLAVVTRFIRINKTRGLSHVYLLIQETIKEGILDIEVTNMPPVRKSHRKQ